MGKFKRRKGVSNKILYYMLLSIVFNIILINYYDKKISDKILDYGSSKLEEISTQFIKKDIVPENIELNNLINVNMNSKEEIIDVDINMDYSRNLMVEIVGRIQKNIDKLESGITQKEELVKNFKQYKENSYIMIPLLISKEGVLTQNLGPKLPIQIDFYEYVLGNIEVTISEYGINNGLLKVYLIIDLEQKMYLPYKEEKFNRKYTLLLGSKVVTGKVPTYYGNMYKKSSEILEA